MKYIIIVDMFKFENLTKRSGVKFEKINQDIPNCFKPTKELLLFVNKHNIKYLGDFL